METAKALLVRSQGNFSSLLWFKCIAVALLTHALVLLVPLSHRAKTPILPEPITTLEVELVSEAASPPQVEEVTQSVDPDSDDSVSETSRLTALSEPTPVEVITGQSVPKEPTELEVSSNIPSIRTMQEWVSRSEFQRADTQSKIDDISKPRKGSYVETLFDPNRLDVSDSIFEEVIRVGNLAISVVRVKGVQYCAPNGDWFKKYRCGDIDYTNRFLDHHGRVKNSDRVDWKVE